MGLLTKLFGTRSQRELKTIEPIVCKIEALEEEYKTLTDEQLQAKTPELKARLADGETLVLNQGEMYFHKPNETHKLQSVKGNAPNIFIVTFLSISRGKIWLFYTIFSICQPQIHYFFRYICS